MEIETNLVSHKLVGAKHAAINSWDAAVTPFKITMDVFPILLRNLGIGVIHSPFTLVDKE